MGLQKAKMIKTTKESIRNLTEQETVKTAMRIPIKKKESARKEEA